MEICLREVTAQAMMCVFCLSLLARRVLGLEVAVLCSVPMLAGRVLIFSIIVVVENVHVMLDIQSYVQRNPLWDGCACTMLRFAGGSVLSKQRLRTEFTAVLIARPRSSGTNAYAQPHDEEDCTTTAGCGREARRPKDVSRPCRSIDKLKERQNTRDNDESRNTLCSMNRPNR